MSQFLLGRGRNHGKRTQVQIFIAAQVICKRDRVFGDDSLYLLSFQVGLIRRDFVQIESGASDNQR